jgi:acyl dehydratase
MKYWEDFQVGERAELGRHTFTEEEIVDFGRHYDPQPFHIDVEQAKRSAFGGLIASGWQTCAIGMRLMVEGYIRQTLSLGSPGIDNIRWLKPVRPGDTLRARFTVVEAVPSRSKPDRGVVRSFSEMLNQHGDVVMTVRGLGIFARRPVTS